MALNLQPTGLSPELLDKLAGAVAALPGCAGRRPSTYCSSHNFHDPVAVSTLAAFSTVARREGLPFSTVGSIDGLIALAAHLLTPPSPAAPPREKERERRPASRASRRWHPFRRQAR